MLTNNEELASGTDATVATTDSLLDRLAEIDANRLSTADQAAYLRKREVATRLAELSNGVLSVCYWPGGGYYLCTLGDDQEEAYCMVTLDDLDEGELRAYLVAETRAIGLRWLELADAIERATGGQE